MSKYPECERVAKLSEVSNTCGSFVDWGVNRGYFSRTRKCPRMEQALAEYFKIDLNKVEKERRAILESLSQQEATNGK